MKLIQPYIGKNSTAKLASQDFDVDAIFAACDEIDSKISELGPLVSGVNSTVDYFGIDDLSVDGATMQGCIESYSESIMTSQKEVYSITQSIRECVSKKYNEKQKSYNEDAKAIDERIMKSTKNTNERSKSHG